MKVPTLAHIKDNKIHVYSNGKRDVVDPPDKPFILVEKGVLGSRKATETWIKVPEDEETEFERYSFETINGYNEFRERHSDIRSRMVASSYIEHLYINHQDFFFQFPHSEPLKVLYWDMEVVSKGTGVFSKPITDEVACIGWSLWEFVGITGEKKDSGICWGFNNNGLKIDGTTDGDAVILRKFKDVIKDKDPDVLAGYNSSEFDEPYLDARFNILGISKEGLGRGNDPYIDRDGKVIFPGRIQFDIYNSKVGVVKDQTLFGLKSRSLDEVARFYKIDIEDIEIPEDIGNIQRLLKNNPDLLRRYQRDDVLRTEFVGNIYLRNCIMLAETMGVPLQSIVSMYPSFVPKLVVARNMHKRRLIATGTNFQRYNENTGYLQKLGTRFEAAIVGIYKRGLFQKLYKIDFAGMYPSAIQTLNLGSDTTSIVDKLPYTGRYRFSRSDKYNWYRIPDRNFNCDILIRVRNDKTSFLKEEISKFKDERAKVKKELKSCSNDRKHVLESQQYAIKVILNSIFGFTGLKSSTYGDMGTAIAIVGFCRWLTLRTMQKYRDVLCETDTDGLLVSQKISEDEVNTWISKLVQDKFGITNNYMVMELEEFGKAYLYKAKNYILQDDDDYIIHGSSLKASRASRVKDRAVQLGIQHIFNDKPEEEVISEALDFSGLTVKDFAERVRLSKNPVDYEDQTDNRLCLAKQVEMKTGQVVTEGTQISYVIQKNRLPFKELDKFYKKKSGRNFAYISYVDDLNTLDMNYYREQVLKELKKFNVEPNKQLELDLGIVDNSGLDKVPEYDLEWKGE